MNNFPDGLLWFPDSLSGKGKQASGAFPAAWDFFPRSQFVMDEAGAIQYKDKMHIDWLNDFLEWTPILLMVLVAVVFLVALKWRSGRMKKFLEEWKRKIVRQAEAGNPSAQFRLGRIYQEGDGVEKDPDRAEDWFHRALPGLKQKADAGDADAAFDLYDCFMKVWARRRAIRRPCTGCSLQRSRASRRPCLTWPWSTGKAAWWRRMRICSCTGCVRLRKRTRGTPSTCWPPVMNTAMEFRRI